MGCCPCCPKKYPHKVPTQPDGELDGAALCPVVGEGGSPCLEDTHEGFEGIRWSDPDFTPDKIVNNLGPLASDDGSSGLQRSVRDIQWLRLSELGYKMELVPDKVEAWDIHQGQFPDCHLITTAAVLAASGAEEIRRLFATQHLNREGKYTLRFCRRGEWVSVDVDDLIPCSSKRTPLFARSRTMHAWPLLLEKAYAKFYGSYAAINGGNIGECMYDVTGCPVESLNLRRPGLEAPIRSGALYRQLADLHAVGAVMTAGMPTSPAGVHVRVGKGLVAGHAYGVLGFKTVKHNGRTVQLVKLHNPWGAKGADWWRGDWGSSSEKWTKQLKQEVGFDPSHEGVFFISALDFFHFFDTINICHTAVRGLPATTFDGAFTPQTAGGCSLFPTFRCNDCYQITTPTPSEVFIMVANDEQRGRVPPGTISYNQVGYTVIKPLETRLGEDAVSPVHFLPSNHQEIRKPTFWNKREVCGVTPVAPGPLPYICVVSTYHPMKLGNYKVTFHAPEEVVVEKVDWSHFHTTNIELGWRAKEALLVLRVKPSRDAQLHIFLTQESIGGGPPPSTPAAYYIDGQHSGRGRCTSAPSRPHPKPKPSRARSVDPGRRHHTNHNPHLSAKHGTCPIALALRGENGEVLSDTDFTMATEVGVSALAPADLPLCIEAKRDHAEHPLRFDITVLSTAEVDWDTAPSVATPPSLADPASEAVRKRGRAG